MSRKREAVFMGIGILAGLALSGPTVHAATTLTATLSNQPIYVDGQRVPMTAYAIGGNNYVRLRDIGQAMNFAVDYGLGGNICHPSTETLCWTLCAPLATRCRLHQCLQRKGVPARLKKYMSVLITLSISYGYSLQGVVCCVATKEVEKCARLWKISTTVTSAPFSGR